MRERERKRDSGYVDLSESEGEACTNVGCGFETVKVKIIIL